jgi:hypothetical protein
LRASFPSPDASTTLRSAAAYSQPPELRQRGMCVKRSSDSPSWADPDYQVSLDGASSASGAFAWFGPCVINCTNDNEVYSFHRGANILFAGRSARLMGNSVDYCVFEALFSRAAARRFRWGRTRPRPATDHRPETNAKPPVTFSAVCEDT